MDTNAHTVISSFLLMPQSSEQRGHHGKNAGTTSHPHDYY